MPSDFFTSLGQRVAAEIASPSGRYPSSPDRRQQIAGLVNRELNQHISRPPMTAKDAMPAAMRPRLSRDQDPSERNGNGNGPFAFGNGQRGDQEPGEGGTQLDAEACMMLLTKCVNGLSDEEKDRFMGMVADFMQTDPSSPGGNGFPGSTNIGALDRRPRSARDTGTRKPAMDSATRQINRGGFQNRWGSLTDGVNVWGRY